MIGYNPVQKIDGQIVMTYDDICSRLTTLAAWLEQLPEDARLTDPGELVCFCDCPHDMARTLRFFLPAENRIPA